jgi:hypothetical protein
MWNKHFIGQLKKRRENNKNPQKKFLMSKPSGDKIAE